MHTGMINKKDTDRYIEHYLSVDPTFFQMLPKKRPGQHLRGHAALYPRPTLIIGGELDKFTPVWLSKKMHRLDPGSPSSSSCTRRRTPGWWSSRT
jgi:pimeloyl-ACP methyl ester carboxylesterase